MGNEPERSDACFDLSTLLRGVVHDAETLIGLQFDLLRSEVRQELRQARDAALSTGAGAALIGAGGVLASLMAVHALQRATRLPLWACSTAPSAACSMPRVARSSWSRASASRGRPRRPAADGSRLLEENLAWIKDQATPRET